jgi:hypothetical protein
VKRLILFSTILFLCASWSTSTPQLRDENTNAIIKASFVYNFAKLVVWPEKRSNGNFVIGIIGDPELYRQIVEKYSEKKIGSQSVEILQLMGAEQLPDLHMLFVSRKLSGLTSKASAALKKKNTMIITENPKGLSQGATLNFIVVENQQKFEISETNASNQGLTIGLTLKSLAHKLVK